MGKYKTTKDDWGICFYIGIDFDIRVERGSLSNNRATGYTVINKDGKVFDSFMTLKEAKDYISGNPKKPSIGFN